MKKTKLVAVVAAAIIGATTIGALAGCGTDPEHTINVFLLANAQEQTVYRSYFKELESELQEEFGEKYSISFRGQEKGPYYQKLASDNSGGEQDLPDIFYLRPNELLIYKDRIANLQSYADSQTAVNLDDIYESALNMYRLNPATGTLGNEEDDLYAFPKDLSTQQLGYNKTLLSQYEVAIHEAGYKMPWEMDFTTKTYTWTEYQAICKVIADKAAADKKSIYASDIPSIEILTKSFGTSGNDTLIDLSGGRAEGKINELKSGPVAQAIQYQAGFVDCGAGNYSATYSEFSAGRVCFYGLVASWEIAEYNDIFGDGNWEVMPWPTRDGGTNWQGVIMSAGYVVSKTCAESAKGDVAKYVALSLLSGKTQERFVKNEKITLPLRPSVADDYISSANDTVYSPKTRKYFLDVISGDHGFFSATYSTYDADWMKPLNTQLEIIWNAGKGAANNKLSGIEWDTVKEQMQTYYDMTKNS